MYSTYPKSSLQIYTYLLYKHQILKYFIIKLTLKKSCQVNRLSRNDEENMVNNIFSHIEKRLNKVINYLCTNYQRS